MIPIDKTGWYFFLISFTIHTLTSKNGLFLLLITGLITTWNHIMNSRYNHVNTFFSQIILWSSFILYSNIQLFKRGLNHSLCWYTLRKLSFRSIISHTSCFMDITFWMLDSISFKNWFTNSLKRDDNTTNSSKTVYFEATVSSHWNTIFYSSFPSLFSTSICFRTNIWSAEVNEGGKIEAISTNPSSLHSSAVVATKSSIKSSLIHKESNSVNFFE